jgi:regulator of sirC expression with transglutaminase-like and TPR domain
MNQANKELDALLKLLDEPNNKIYRDIENRILDIGIEARDRLTDARYDLADEVSRERLERILKEINYRYIKTELQKWVNFHSDDLLHGIMLIAEFQYPELDTDEVRNKIEEIRRDAWLELNKNHTALEEIKILNHVFFDIHEFTANKENFYAPENSFINDVLLFKKGNPISLSILYSIIAQKLDIPVYGVNLPEHFILAYVNAPSPMETNQDNILFYINAFNKGIIFTKDEILRFLKKINLDPHESFFLPCSNVTIIQRVINNLIYSFHNQNKEEKANQLDELQRILREKRKK